MSTYDPLMSATTDLGLEKLRAEFPLDSQVRISPGFVDPGVHKVIGHERAHHPFRSLLLRMRTPEGEQTLQRAEWWRHAE